MATEKAVPVAAPKTVPVASAKSMPAQRMSMEALARFLLDHGDHSRPCRSYDGGVCTCDWAMACAEAQAVLG